MRWRPQCTSEELHEQLTQVGWDNAHNEPVTAVVNIVAAAFDMAIYPPEGGEVKQDHDQDKIHDSEVFKIDQPAPLIPAKREPNKVWTIIEKNPDFLLGVFGFIVVMTALIFGGIWLLKPNTYCPKCGNTLRVERY